MIVTHKIFSLSLLSLGYEPVKITFQIFVLAKLRFCGFCQKSTREYRARGKMVSKSKFRNLRLKSCEESKNQNLRHICRPVIFVIFHYHNGMEIE